MPECKKCRREKDMFSFPFIDRKSCYSNVCKECRKTERRNCECEKIRRNWDAIPSENSVWKRRGEKK